MDIINAILLGVIQGLTEFLPVSSSGHLEILKAILGEDKVGKESMLMTVVLHFATALSTIIVFRKEIKNILIGLLQFQNNEEFKFSIKIIISMFPAALIGVFFDEEIEALFGGALTLVGCMLIFTGILLFLADKSENTKKNIGINESILIGISQAIAILPARLESSRLPRKALKDICGLPMIVHVFKRCLLSANCLCSNDITDVYLPVNSCKKVVFSHFSSRYNTLEYCAVLFKSYDAC